MLATFAATMYAQTAKNLQASAESSSLETMPSAAKSYAKVEDRVTTLEGEVKTLKGQVETQNGQIASMQSRLNELADRNAEYKKALDIQQVLTATVDSIKYGIASAEGNSNTGEVVVTLVALNEGQSKYMGFTEGATFNDYDGNIYKSDEDLSVGGQSSVELVRHNISTKIIVKFANVPVKTRISAFSVIYANGPYFTLSDININWK